jgi:hypothetical protein
MVHRLFLLEEDAEAVIASEQQTFPPVVIRPGDPDGAVFGELVAAAVAVGGSVGHELGMGVGVTGGCGVLVTPAPYVFSSAVTAPEGLFLRHLHLAPL